jgi:hypothetical protein
MSLIGVDSIETWLKLNLPGDEGETASVYMYSKWQAFVTDEPDLLTSDPVTKVWSPEDFCGVQQSAAGKHFANCSF